MIIFLGLIFIVALWGLRKADIAEYDYMSKQMTNSIKGIFICLVFLSHISISGYTDFTHPILDHPYRIFRGVTGQCIVTMFLFYSGFGIMESIKKRGAAYIRQLPIQRILKTFLLFDSAVLIFLILLGGGRVNTNVQVLLAFTGWTSIGNSNWYIFCILWLYLFTFIAFLVYPTDYRKAAICIGVLSLLYMAVMSIPELGKSTGWYDTVLCFPMGIFFSLYRPRIENWVQENLKTWMFSLFIFILGFIVAYFHKEDFFVYQIQISCFVFFCLTFTMRFVIDSRVLRWLGENLFELYILQRLPMIILKPYILTENSVDTVKYVYVIICFITTIIISIIYKRTVRKGIEFLVHKIICNKKVFKEKDECGGKKERK